MKSLKKFSSLEEFKEAYSTPVTEEISFECPLGTAVYLDNNGKKYLWQIDGGILLCTFSRIPKIGVETFESFNEKDNNNDLESARGAFDVIYSPKENPESYFVEITKVNIVSSGQYKRPWTSLTKNGNVTGMTAALKGGSPSEWTLVKKIRVKNVIQRGDEYKK